jgi:hypothetical protein
LSCKDPNSTSTEDDNPWPLELLYREQYFQANREEGMLGGREEAVGGGHAGSEGEEIQTESAEACTAAALLYAQEGDERKAGGSRESSLWQEGTRHGAEHE